MSQLLADPSIYPYQNLIKKTVSIIKSNYKELVPEGTLEKLKDEVNRRKKALKRKDPAFYDYFDKQFGYYSSFYQKIGVGINDVDFWMIVTDYYELTEGLLIEFDNNPMEDTLEDDTAMNEGIGHKIIGILWKIEYEGFKIEFNFPYVFIRLLEDLLDFVLGNIDKIFRILNKDDNEEFRYFEKILKKIGAPLKKIKIGLTLSKEDNLYYSGNSLREFRSLLRIKPAPSVDRG